MLVELQALVAPSSVGPASAGGAGWRVFGVAAGGARRAAPSGSGAPAMSDVYALAVGGVRVIEPGADLGLALAIASALTDRTLPAGLVACGEIGLAGELRQVGQTGRRLAEPPGWASARRSCRTRRRAPAGIEVIRASTLVEAIGALSLLGPPSVPALSHVPP